MCNKTAHMTHMQFHTYAKQLDQSIGCNSTPQPTDTSQMSSTMHSARRSIEATMCKNQTLPWSGRSLQVQQASMSWTLTCASMPDMHEQLDICGSWGKCCSLTCLIPYLHHSDVACPHQSTKQSNQSACTKVAGGCMKCCSALDRAGQDGIPCRGRWSRPATCLHT